MIKDGTKYVIFAMKNGISPNNGLLFLNWQNRNTTKHMLIKEHSVFSKSKHLINAHQDDTCSTDFVNFNVTVP